MELRPPRPNLPLFKKWAKVALVMLSLVEVELPVLILFYFLQQWNETYLHYHKVDPKQTYYLSMEFLQGRALTNAIGNLDIQDAYAAALNKLGHELEEIVEQVIKLMNSSRWDIEDAYCSIIIILRS